ncbi:MAG TPA: hypothetical protein VK473_13400 [Terriglobales bacterium]|nr:hypothetical protein [Terriglobales bacterium]
MNRLEMENFEADSAAALGRSKRLWLLHFLMDAALFSAFFGWLRIPDQRALQFLGSVLAGLALAFLAVWLQAATLTYFQSDHEKAGASLAAAARRALMHLPAFLVWLIIFAAALWLVSFARTYNGQLAGYVRHLLPGALRSSVSPRQVARIGAWIFFSVFWFLVPLFFLPLGTQAAARGFRGLAGDSLRRALRAFLTLRCWIVYAVCFMAGIWAPWKLARMFPRWDDPGTLERQATSAGLRFFVGYVLLITAWLLLASALGRLTAERAEPPAAVSEPASGQPPGKEARAPAES